MYPAVPGVRDQRRGNAAVLGDLRLKRLELALGSLLIGVRDVDATDLDALPDPKPAPVHDAMLRV